MRREPPELTPELIESYTGNIVQIETPDGPVRLGQTGVLARAASVPKLPVTYIHAIWNPYGRPSSAQENASWADPERWYDPDESLLARAVTFASDLSWVEAALAMTTEDPNEAQVSAGCYGQPGLLRWRGSELALLRTSSMEAVRHWSVAVEAVPTRPCFMEARSRTSPCERRGGPWTSRSIEAALEWELDFAARAVAMGGCDLCGADPRGPGGPIGLVEMSLPSRYQLERIDLGPA